MFSFINQETKRLKTAPRDADDVGHEHSGSGRGASTAEEVQRSLYGDDAGDNAFSLFLVIYALVVEVI